MYINDPPQIPQMTPQALLKPVISSWQVGQILDAKVVDIPAKDTVMMLIDEVLIPAKTTRNHTVGETLKLVVLNTGQQPALKVLNTVATQNPVSALLKVLLPVQAPLPPLLANLNALTKPDIPLPPQLAQLIKSVVTNLPTVDRLTSASALKQTLENSGIFLEKKLAGTPSGITRDLGLANDFKANLLRLQTALQQLQPATKQSVDVLANREDGKSSSGPRSTAPGNPLPDSKTLSISTTPAPTATPTAAARSGQMPSPPLPALETLQIIVDEPESAVTKTELPVTSSAKPPLFPLPGAPLQAQKAAIPTVLTQEPISNLASELTQQLSGALARVQLTQLSSLASSEGATPLWSFEIPLKVNDRLDVLQLQISEEDASRQSESERRWSATVALNLENLGPLYAQITISRQKVWTTLWAEDNVALKLIHEHMDKLSQSYSQAGLIVGDISCRRGQPPASKTVSTSQFLIDINV